MPLSTTHAVKETFRRAIREDLKRALHKGEDWDRFNATQRETDARLMSEQAAHAREYTQRIAEAKEIILREENGVRLDQPLPPGAMRHSDADALQAKADIRVRQDYDRRIAAITRDELDHFKELAAEIRARDAPTPSINPTQDRSHDRSGPTRI